MMLPMWLVLYFLDGCKAKVAFTLYIYSHSKVAFTQVVANLQNIKNVAQKKT